MSYELGLQHLEKPMEIDVLPFPLMTEEEFDSYNSIDENAAILYPELGSRAFENQFTSKASAYGEWHVIQNGRYRYVIGQSSGDWVKFVLSEYLACRVVWK